MTNKFAKKKQQTIINEISIKGIGLHTGVETTATFKPAKENSGIRFKRSDLKNCPEIIANIDHVVDIARGTTIGQDDFKIHTVEHILSAVFGLEIDNILIELTEKEPPVMDGSAKPFVEALLNAGIKKQDSEREELIIDQTITYNNPKYGIDIHILPSDKFRVTFMTDYKEAALGTQYTAMYSLENDFIDQFAPARTFCLFSEILSLKKKGLIKGGSLDNAIVFKDQEINEDNINELAKIFNSKFKINNNSTILNQSKLRFENEPVRHKVVDLIGDLALLGTPIRGHVIAARSGHASNVELVKKIKKTYLKTLTLREKQKEANKISFDIEGLMDIIPHRYPFLLIDRITNLKPGKIVHAIKNVSINEPFFQGHFEGQPVMPGVLLLEAMAQAGGFLVLNSIENPETKLMYFTGVNQSRFKKTVTPGDQVVLEVKLEKFKLGTCVLHGTASVDGSQVAEGEILASVVNRR
ncbi:MAG: bifunctional UDP-3-O-[3-hydroxymyristoyl] N-acetylglucosamine deacetylase/3-hydroxyacyl-ACP dehydratase [Candidatus Neomarinimicrobiota bacterium]|nr:bifunctional UDP-3-O-[3-hydroxymyristoyl] N-acetylglucosamine deacetylase/3-hydroxyacyl-ACP dehydratase [Candidatus Neomarinimicrobiota bacterium]